MAQLARAPLQAMNTSVGMLAAHYDRGAMAGSFHTIEADIRRMYEGRQVIAAAPPFPPWLRSARAAEHESGARYGR